VTVPRLRTIFLTTVMLSTIWTATNLQFVLVLTRGGPASRTEADNKTVVMHSPENVAGVKVIEAMFKTHKIIPPGAISWDNSGNNKAYQSKQAAFVMNPTSIYAYLDGNDKDLQKVTGLMPVPAGPKGAVNQIDTWAYGAFKKTPYPELAKGLLEYFMQPANYDKIISASWSPTRRRNAYADRAEYWREAACRDKPPPVATRTGHFDPGVDPGDADGGSLTSPTATVTVSPGLIVCTAAAGKRTFTGPSTVWSVSMPVLGSTFCTLPVTSAVNAAATTSVCGVGWLCWPSAGSVVTMASARAAAREPSTCFMRASFLEATVGRAGCPEDRKGCPIVHGLDNRSIRRNR
jgi:hypothetical protein